ncbi:MAG: cobalamin-binding protein [Candidatus Aminicenantes bacterium]|nr:cobalamin-binding protein [Candidatus Aminicenantes bacterium]NIM81106.1 cobalamin-binding protein [Candidatus Aminicenantes bacterium]NIN20480.1 cobalamin-binding protein [Candidatus Aminicenantes bacterium]NIN44253.1 cobalamin-binding protein [Candidatus Aminicenantes bacterium]NIN87072.1 cobalamin-binding protein [Candidatus Aminicenantes bacterium]
MTIFEKIADEVQKGNSQTVEELVKEALSTEVSVEGILNEGLVEGMNIVGEKFKNNECFIPEVLVSAKAMKLGLEILKPLLAETNVKPLGRVVIGTIQGDLHDIGKNIVSMLLQGAGFEVIDLGADVPIDRFVESAKNEKADLVGMSALLITTMVNMKEVIQGLKEAGLKDDVKVIVGGAPVTRDFAEKIGADGYAPDAASGVDVARKLLNL